MANAIHKTTMEYRRSIHWAVDQAGNDVLRIPGADPSDWIKNPDVSGCSPEALKSRRVVIEGSVVREMTAAEERAAKMADYRRAASSRIDGRTGDLIGRGFALPGTPGKLYSLSASAVAKVNAYAIERTQLDYTVPITIHTVDGSGRRQLATPAQVAEFHLEMTSALRSIWDGDAALKEQIRAATTPAELKAIRDNRTV